MYKKTMVMLGMLLAGDVSPLMAKGELDLDTIQGSSMTLTGTTKLIKNATESTGNTAITLILWGAMAMGVGFFFWGAYMAASKDQREEGKAKDGIKLAGLGIIFIAAVSVIKSIVGVSN